MAISCKSKCAGTRFSDVPVFGDSGTRLSAFFARGPAHGRLHENLRMAADDGRAHQSATAPAHVTPPLRAEKRKGAPKPGAGHPGLVWHALSARSARPPACGTFVFPLRVGTPLSYDARVNAVPSFPRSAWVCLPDAPASRDRTSRLSNFIVGAPPMAVDMKVPAIVRAHSSLFRPTGPTSQTSPTCTAAINGFPNSHWRPRQPSGLSFFVECASAHGGLYESPTPCHRTDAKRPGMHSHAKRCAYP